MCQSFISLESVEPFEYKGNVVRYPQLCDEFSIDYWLNFYELLSLVNWLKPFFYNKYFPTLRLMQVFQGVYV